jgi:hypothetical protein
MAPTHNLTSNGVTPELEKLQEPFIQKTAGLLVNLSYKLINKAAVLWINISKHMYKSFK